MMQVAQQLAQAGDQQGAMQVAQQARAAQEQLAKTSSEGVIGKLLQSGKYTPESVNTYAKTGSGLELADKGGGEFEHLLKTLNLPPAQANQLRQQRAMAMLNNDPNGIKAVTAQLAALQLQEKEFKFKQEQEKAIGEKTQAIQKLSSVESNVEDSLDTAAKALKLAPGSFMQASGQALAANIPWTDQRSLKNLVSSLNSDKAIGTLQDLKAQSKTGATGFGALNTKELQLVLDKTRSLDPSDKMFKENLLTVMEGWQKIQKGAMESRINLQGNEGKLKELRSLVSAVKTKGAMTAAQKDQIDALKSELGIR
jgi:hypothetical protein